MSVIEDIKQKTDIVEVVGQYVKLTRSGRMMKANCPFHSETKPSFFVYPEQQSWHCFGACNTGGDVFSFIMKKEGVDFGEAMRLLADKAGVVIHSQSDTEAQEQERDKTYRINQTAAQYFHDLLLKSPAAEKARNYLSGRGLNLETMIKFQLGYSPSSWDSLKQYLQEREHTEAELLTAGLIVKADTGKTYDRFRDHLMFPIADDRGRVTGFGARVLDNSLPKYINSPQTPIFDKSGSLYGIHLAKASIRKKNLAVLVEGYMDVIVAHQYGFDNVIAPMGTAITDRQINQIKRMTPNIALALDADAAGEEAAMRCVEYENSLDAEVKVIVLPAGKDPDEVIKEDAAGWEKLVEKATPVIEYTIRTEAAKLDLSKTENKSQLVSKILPILSSRKKDTYLGNYLDQLSRLTGVSHERLEAALARTRPELRTRESGTEALKRAVKSIGASPVEEYCLALLLQHAELKAGSREEILPEYFESSENAAIFTRWLNTENTDILKESLDPAIREHFDALLVRKIPDSPVEEKYADVVLRLHEKYIRNIEKKKAEAYAQEKDGGTAADIEEKGIEGSLLLKKVFSQRAKTSKEQ
jgi:DNA primase